MSRAVPPTEEPREAGSVTTRLVQADLLSQLKWLTLFRVALFTVLLVATFSFSLQDDRPGGERAYVNVYYLCMATYVASLVYLALMRQFQSFGAVRRIAFVQFTVDSLTATALVLLTGGTSSAFTFFYSLVIIGGAVVLLRPGAFYLATLSAGLLVTIGLMEVDLLSGWAGLDEFRHAFAPEIDLLLRGDRHERAYRVIYGVSVNTLAFFGVGFLAASLSEKLGRSTVELSTQRQTLVDLRALHEHIVNSVPSGIMTCDAQRRTTSANPAAARMLGRSTLQLLDVDIVSIFPWLKYPVEALARSEEVVRDEGAVSIDRRRIYLGWTLAPLRRPDGTRVGLTFVFQDITRMRELEHNMRRSEKMAAIGELSAAIAHEVRNPLAAISGCVQMLEQSPSSGDKERRLMRIVQRETEHLNSWITDFLSYSRPTPLELRPTDVASLVYETIESLRSDPTLHGAELVHVRGEPIFVLGDGPRLRHVFWNLILNGAQAVLRRGPGTVSVMLSANLASSRPEVEVRVEDQGDGIPAENLERIFQPFFTTRERGTGLGLAVVHRIVQDHDGRIGVDSQPDRGTFFTVTLPLALGPLSDDRTA